MRYDPMPFPEGKYLTTKSGYAIHYHEAGERQPGKPSILFLHGSGPGASGYSNFKQNYPVFAAAGYHCLVIDYPGFGYSSMPTDIEYTTEFYVAQFIEFMDALHIDQVVPVGNSLGGSLAIGLALDHPDRVERLILMAPGGLVELSTFVPFQVGLYAIQQWLKGAQTDAQSFREVLGHLVFDPSRLTDEAVSERLPIALSQPKEVWIRRRTRHHTERLKDIACPILCFWGSRDKFVPVSQGQILLERAPDVRLVTSNRCGHWYMIEEADDFNAQSIAFLARPR